MHLGWPVRAIRIAFVCLILVSGAGVLLYAWLWVFSPLEQPTETIAPVSRRVPVAAALVIAAAVSVLAELSALVSSRESAANLPLAVAILCGGGAVAWSLVLDAADPTRSVRYGVLVRATATFALLLAGIAVLLARPTVANLVLGMVAILLAIGVLVAPRLVSLWGALLAERAARVRQDQRAEIAAHLHDSVLQTLALIQVRAGASSEVARIARAQERELRDWLFADDSPAVADLATELRELAAVIELDYSARIDVVAAGVPVSVAPAALVGAAREAMLNAARHAGGEVSVYVESTDRTIDVFVRDRGAGVDLASLPDDRLGIRESIIGRMTRAGGTAAVGRGAGGGTEVHLRLERGDD
jgi:signal transduction histidine kinase